MNSEELEKSLRTEFESYLKEALADMRQEVFQLQYKLDSELEKYKSQIDEVFKDFSEKIREDKAVSETFQDTIVEHLRLARDDGATITATAIAEAEKLEKEMTPSDSLDVSELRDAINDISSQTSQATILKSLINHAETFVPRGAFFVVKNQNFVGWRVFGNEDPSGDDDIREIYFDISSPTVLSNSVNSLQTVESAYGSFEEDSVFLDPLNFGEPDRMYAIPLIARGRGVAVVYADQGESGGSVNVAALETLVRIAGLTVELLAASHNVASRSAAPAESSYSQSQEVEEEETETVQAAEETESYPAYEDSTETFEDETEETVEEFESEETYQVSEDSEADTADLDESYEESFETAPAVDYQEQEETEEETEAVAETEDSVEDDYSYETKADEDFETTTVQEETESAEEVEEEEFESSETFDFSNETETSTDYDTSPIVKPDQPFADSSFDTNEYLSEDSVSEESTDESFEGVQADDTATFDDRSFETVDAADEIEETEEVSYEEVEEEEFVPGSYEVSETSEATESLQMSDETVSLGEEVSEEIEVEEDPVTVGDEEPTFETSAVDDTEEVSEDADDSEPVQAAPVRSRLSGRNVDLPIEVNEEDRKLHNDARRFARLLVSEIKLYNEQKVEEGRNSGDLYERLREAIDRSREMYDKRVQPPVAERFDYFHYEVVNTLVEGEESKLGSNYPGSNI